MTGAPAPVQAGNAFTPTEEQQAIVSAVAGRGSVMVEAGAGCAKTSSLVLAAAGVRVPALALAFNKRIAEDMAKKLPGTFTTKTFNGLGHAAWARGLPAGTNLKLDDRKLGRLVSATAKDHRLELNSDQWDGLRRLVSGAMMAGLVLGTDPCAENTLVPDTNESWWEIADGLGMFREDFEMVRDVAIRVLAASVAEARAGVISFDDQIYCSTMLGGRFPAFPVVFVDEDQDLTPLQDRMLGQVTRPDGRLVAVGDKRQAIYRWRGASGDSAERIRALRPGDRWTDLPLMTTFRCPRRVVERQQRHVPGYRAAPTVKDGQVVAYRKPFEGTVEWEGWNWERVKLHAQLAGADAGNVAILCRNNGPLLSMAFKLIRRGVGVVMLGRDIGKGLIALSRKLAPEDGTPADTVRGKVEDWERAETSLALANKRPEKVAGIVDRSECLHAVLDGAEVRDAGGLRRQLELLFARETGQVTLSSIHRAKGLEWTVVLHLDPWRIPSRHAKRAAEAGDTDQLEQEYNLRYVCETRTRHTLILADLEDFR